MVLAVIGCERILDAVQNKFSSRNPISVPADERAEISRKMQISVERVVTQHDVVNLPISIRHIDRNDDSAIVRNLYFYSLIVIQREKLHFIAVRRNAESLAGYLR